MAVKTILILAVFACFAAVVLSFPAMEGEFDSVAIDADDTELNRIKEALIKTDVKVGMDSHGRIFTNSQNLSQLLSMAPNTTASFAFIPLSTIFFRG